MNKRARLSVFEVKQIGLSPINQKPQQVAFNLKCSYNDFVSAIQQNFPNFHQQKYVVFLPKLGYLEINEHNFQEFLDSFKGGNNVYSQINILHKYVDTSRVPQSSNQAFVPMAGKAKDDNQDQKDKINILQKVFLQQQLNNDISLEKSDCQILENMNILINLPKEPPTIKQLQEQIATRIIEDLREC